MNHDSTISCPPTDHDFDHEVSEHVQGKRDWVILVFRKCGEVRKEYTTE